ncbi:MAG: hypothetical protein E6Q97_39395 [Desulfurellales bacterium]|nr:MAG: hypothetical protein E6Q97_39395 [Desulfurellales bacterium]
METILKSFGNWKTTLTAIVGFVAYMLGQFGIVITPEQANAIVVVAMLIVGFFAKDATTGSSPV